MGSGTLLNQPWSTSHSVFLIQSPLRELDGAHHRTRFIARLFVFALRLGVRDDARPGLHVGATSVDDDGSDVDAHVHVAGKAEVPHRAGIGAAPRGLELL